jgi:GNAT superfamily N-acetyltransferase
MLSPMETSIHLRRARPDDAAALERLQEAAVRELNRADYTPGQLEAFLDGLGTLDTRLIEDGTYFVAEEAGALVGCGGWTDRAQGCGSASAGSCAIELSSDPDTATMRGYFVRPDRARRGIARRLMRAAEDDALLRGFDRAQLLATLTGEPLYRRLGYEPVERIQVPVSGATSLSAIYMRKEFAR